jgi:uncharacterized sporulation protein YeaH/YhbH (DUF444 family)
MYIVDRRPQSGNKNLTNKNRFIERTRESIKESIRKKLLDSSILNDPIGGQQVKTQGGKNIKEPSFRRNGNVGEYDHVLPGNDQYSKGDTIDRSRASGGRGGSEGSPDGDGQDDYLFQLTREQFYDLYLGDLELPYLSKKSSKDTDERQLVRAGLTNNGSPANLRLLKSMRNSLGRRIALNRPSKKDIEELEDDLRSAIAIPEDPEVISSLECEIARLRKKQKWIPWIDPIDLRYQTFDTEEKPVTKAVMFLLMDVSGSVTEHMKNLSKQFFVLTYIFLKKRYKDIDVVFIRYTHHAEEVDEQTFFYDQQSGGTTDSTALILMKEIINERYHDLSSVNIYALHSSDGDNTSSDVDPARAILVEDILPSLQFFAYVEVHREEYSFMSGDSPTLRSYKSIDTTDKAPIHLALISNHDQIIKVFREMFSKENKEKVTS